jgi:carbonic anhydrase
MLLESILRNNEAFLQGRTIAGRLPSPIAMLTCLDARLNDYLGPALGIAREDIFLIRNAGNVVGEGGGDPLRSLAMAIYLKDATEIVVLGHSDCRMSQFEANDFLNAISTWGVSRQQLGPVDLRRWAGAFHDPRQNVKQSVELIARCPYIPRRVPIHGLLIDIQTGRVEVVVDGQRELSRRSLAGSEAQSTVSAPTPVSVPAAVTAHPAGAPAAAPPPVASTPVPAPLPVNIPGSPKPAPAAAERPLPKDLLGSLKVLRQAYAEMKNSKEYRAEAELIHGRVARGENLLESLDWIERNLRRLSAERPDVIAALRIVREHAERSPAGVHIQKLLNQIL